MGNYDLLPAALRSIRDKSYHRPESATIRVHEGEIESISGNGGSQLDAYELEPEMITSLLEGDHVPNAKWCITTKCPIAGRRGFGHRRPALFPA